MKILTILFRIRNISMIMVFISSFYSNGLFAQDSDHDMHRSHDSTLMQRQHMIHSGSHMVMPFTMNKVTHYFLKNNDGGVLKIKAKDPEDTLQISFIRSHLEHEKDLFSNADFRDPKALHGPDMPGLKILSESKNRFNVIYGKLPDGACLTFTAKDSTVINAIHEWFDAQLKDHGKDARNKE